MLKLALKRIKHARISSAVTLAAVVLTVIVFFLLNSSLKNYSARLTLRADGPLLVVGSRGSGVDLIMKSLYFRKAEHPFINYSYLEEINEHAETAPMFIHYSAKGYPVCSTSIDYFKLRNLDFAEGTQFTKLGDCVLGAAAAKKLKLKIGDQVISDSNNVFNPAGSLPVKMTVKGILKQTGSADDNAFFTSLKTGWTMHGLGHAHPEELEKPDIKETYVDINEETMKTFHFHGNEAEYPLTSILAKAKTTKDEALLLGKSAVSEELTVLHPKNGLQSFLKMLFHMDSLFFLIMVLVLIVIAILMLLIFFLNLRLRKTERYLLDRLGVEKAFFSRLVAAEWLILISSGVLGGYCLSLILNPFFKQIFDAILRG